MQSPRLGVHFGKPRALVADGAVVGGLVGGVRGGRHLRDQQRAAIPERDSADVCLRQSRYGGLH